MHRLFVGIRPPASVRDQLLDLMDGIANVRWQSDEQLHLTLRFIGEVERHQAEDVAVALSRIHQTPFEIALHGVGSFATRGKGMAWAGIKPHDTLKLLHKKVDQACRMVGIAPDERAYHPHITIARFGRASGASEPFLQHWAGLSSKPFRVDDMRLYESQLGSEGASYTTIARYAFAQPDEDAA